MLKSILIDRKLMKKIKIVSILVFWWNWPTFHALIHSFWNLIKIWYKSTILIEIRLILYKNKLILIKNSAIVIENYVFIKLALYPYLVLSESELLFKQNQISSLDFKYDRTIWFGRPNPLSLLNRCCLTACQM